MKIGIISVWCNRGRGVVARRIRNIFEEAGHETFVLALPTKETAPIGNHVDSRGIWNVDNISFAPTFAPAADTYLGWAAETGVEVVFCDMVLQYDEIQQLRFHALEGFGVILGQIGLLSEVARKIEQFKAIVSHGFNGRNP